MDMDEVRNHAGPAEENSPSAIWWPSDFMDKLGSVSLDSKDENLSVGEEHNYSVHDRLASKSASQILWSTGVLSEPITNGFYSVIPEKSLKDLFNDIPTLDEIYGMGDESWRAETILVDAEKDKKLSMLKQLIVVLVKNSHSNLAAVIKKIAGLVSDVYKRPNLELSPARASLGDTFHAPENRGVQMLGQIKHGSCRPRAILFKVLADTVGLECRLMVGLPNEGPAECIDSYKHMSVLVVNNSMEFVVDLMRFPGQLIPRSTKAIYMTHISAAGESDSAEYDSCDSPLEPNSPLYGLSDRVEMDSSSHSEPNVATTVWRRSRRKVIAEQRTASSSPEHPSFRGRARSMLGGDRQSFREFADDLATSRSEGASTSETRRIRRRSISITPEIGDDIVRAVRAMNETLKQNRLLREHEDYQSFSCSSNPTNIDSDHKKDESEFGHHNHGMISGTYAHLKEQLNSSKSMSLPSSPHEFRGQTYEKGGTSDAKLSDKTVSVWNKVLELPMFQNKPLLPFQEWNIDYKELTVGTRVGIGFFGEVFRGIWNGTDVAIKVFLEQDLTAENMEDFCNEISILSRLRHPNVILFLGACTRPPHLSMVTEYMEMGSLYYLIHLSGQKKKISWRRRLKMLRDICRGLMCLHRMKIVHRDLKSANCLVNKHWTVKICDFGLSRMMTNMLSRDSSSAGTPEWMAPELIRNETFTEKCDIFSLGVIMWELCTLNRPWDGVPPERVVYAVANEGARLEIPEGPLGKLITDCWGEPQERPSCEEILTRLLDCEYSLC